VVLFVWYSDDNKGVMSSLDNKLNIFVKFGSRPGCGAVEK
jgi:hypothetical protein